MDDVRGAAESGEVIRYEWRLIEYSSSKFFKGFRMKQDFIEIQMQISHFFTNLYGLHVVEAGSHYKLYAKESPNSYCINQRGSPLSHF